LGSSIRIEVSLGFYFGNSAVSALGNLSYNYCLDKGSFLKFGLIFTVHPITVVNVRYKYFSVKISFIPTFLPLMIIL
jgi:hypothetical protein